MRKEAVEEGRRWLTQAREDLRWAKHLAEEGAYYLACFLAQQVAEKALKAFLYAQGAEIVLGHSVRRLVDQASAIDPDFARAGADWGTLDGYYIPTRYPNGLPEGIPSQVYTARAAREALALAEEAVHFVESRLEDR